MPPFPMQTQTQTQCFPSASNPLVTLRISLPQGDGHHPVARRFHGYYQAQRRAYTHYVTHVVVPLAQQMWDQCQETGAWFAPVEATLDYVLTYQDHGLVSLYTQSKETGLDRGLVQRHGDTWDVDSGFPVPITHFFPEKQGYRTKLAAAALEQIRQWEAQGVAQFYPHVNQAVLKRQFNPQKYYITPEGLWFFYPMFAIAPSVEQIPTFFYPLPARDSLASTKTIPTTCLV